MKNLSVVLNIVLLAAVGFLYYLKFSGKDTKKTAGSPVAAKAGDSIAADIKVAYVDLDSLNEKIVYFKQKRKEIEQQQRNNEAEINNDLRMLEAKQNSFIQKNPNPTPDEVQQIRAQLAQDQQGIEAKRQKYTQSLNQQNFEMVEKIRKELKDFFAEYNREKKFHYILTTSADLDYIIYKDSTLNITNDVIKGMNEKLKVKQ
ncbi:MAG: OmpH family outer membrane protein [Ferruginibacter sp.]